MKQIGIAMIGYGGVGRVHALAYRSIPFHYALPADTIKIIGLADVNKNAAETAAHEINCDFWTSDYHELLRRDDVDMVDICVPNHLHEEIIVESAKAGKHIFCEKPLALTVEQGKRIVDAVEKAGVKNQLNFNFRFFPAVTRARQLIEEGFLGRIFSYRACYYRSSYINPNKPLSWRLNKEIAGGGALFDLGSHVLDLVYYLLGDFKSILATVDTLIKERPVSPGATKKGAVDVDDIALLHTRMVEMDIPGSIEISRMGTGVTNELKIEIFGEKGAIRFDAQEPSWLEVFDVRDPELPVGGMSGFRKIQTVSRFEGHKVPDWSMAPGFITTFSESQYKFIQSVTNDKAAAPSLKDGLHIQKVMEAAIVSSDERRWVAIIE